MKLFWLPQSFIKFFSFNVGVELGQVPFLRYLISYFTVLAIYKELQEKSGFIPLSIAIAAIVIVLDNSKSSFV